MKPLQRVPIGLSQTPLQDNVPVNPCNRHVHIVIDGPLSSPALNVLLLLRPQHTVSVLYYVTSREITQESKLM